MLFYAARFLAVMPSGIRGFMEKGYEAVGFFFVLSGFVRAYSYCAPPARSVRGGAVAFWKRRFARIYPVYLLATLIALPRYLWGLKVGTIRPLDASIGLIVVPLPLQFWFLAAQAAIIFGIRLGRRAIMV